MSAFEFGVHNAMLGVKKMLALIWSREASIKVGNKPEMKHVVTITQKTVPSLLICNIPLKLVLR